MEKKKKSEIGREHQQLHKLFAGLLATDERERVGEMLEFFNERVVWEVSERERSLQTTKIASDLVKRNGFCPSSLHNFRERGRMGLSEEVLLGD